MKMALSCVKCRIYLGDDRVNERVATELAATHSTPRHPLRKGLISTQRGSDQGVRISGVEVWEVGVGTGDLIGGCGVTGWRHEVKGVW